MWPACADIGKNFTRNYSLPIEPSRRNAKHGAMKTLLIGLSMLSSVALVFADACEDYSKAVDTYIAAVKDSKQKLDTVGDAHAFASALDTFTKANQSFANELIRLEPELSKLTGTDSNTPPAGCDKAQERVTNFQAELSTISSKFGEVGQKYISDAEVQAAFDRLKQIQLDTNDEAKPSPSATATPK